MEGSDRKKLARGRGTGNVTFGSESEAIQAAKVQGQLEEQTRRALMTPQERFESIERSIKILTGQLGVPPHIARAVHEELG